MCALTSFLWVKTYKGANHTVWITAGRQLASLCNVRKPAIKIKTKALGPPRYHHGRQWWHCHRNIHAGFNSTPETWVTADLANTYRRGLSAAAASAVAAWYTSAPSFKCVMSTLLIINQLQPRWFPATLCWLISDAATFYVSRPSSQVLFLMPAWTPGPPPFRSLFAKPVMHNCSNYMSKVLTDIQRRPRALCATKTNKQNFQSMPTSGISKILSVHSVATLGGSYGIGVTC